MPNLNADMPYINAEMPILQQGMSNARHYPRKPYIFLGEMTTLNMINYKLQISYNNKTELQIQYELIKIFELK